MSFARRRRKYDGRTDRAGDDAANLFGTGLPRWRRLAGPGYPLEENVTTDSGRVPPCAPPAGAPAGTHGNNASWEEKLVAPARGPGRSMMRKLASSLVLTLVVPDRVRAPKPARGAPFTIHRHTIVASTATRSATPRFMGMADGADKTFSSHPAGIAGRARRVRLPAIEGLRGKGVLPSTRLRRFAHCLALELGLKAARIAAPSRRPLVRSSPEK